MKRIGGIYRMQSKQWLAALAASLAMINVGTEGFWIRRTLKNMSATNEMDKNTWIVLSIVAVSTVIGGIFGAVLADRFGRRKTLLMTSIFTISQLISSFTTSRELSCVTLFLGVIGLGMTRVTVPLFISEIVDDNIRGTLLMLQLPFFYVGKLVAVGIGKFVSAEIVGVVLLIITSIFLIIFTWLPETPYYLAVKKRNDASTKSLTFYRGTERLAAQNEIDEAIKSDGEVCRGKFQELGQLTNRKALFIIMFLGIVSWDEQIFDVENDLIHALVGTVVSTDECAEIITHMTSLIASFLIVFTVDVIGRRPFLLYSHFTTFIIIIVYIVFLITKYRANDWIHFVLRTNCYFSQLLFFAVPLVYAGELFSSNVKALAIAILTIFHQLRGLFFITLLPGLANMDVGTYISGVLVLVGLPITFAFIPETKRKSFSDIQSELAKTLHCKWLKEKLTRKHPK